MEKFKVGDRVKIKRSSEFYGKNPSNPAGKIGVVYDIRPTYDNLNIYVRWDEGNTNCYHKRDLKLYKKDKKEITFSEVFKHARSAIDFLNDYENWPILVGSTSSDEYTDLKISIEHTGEQPDGYFRQVRLTVSLKRKESDNG